MKEKFRSKNELYAIIRDEAGVLLPKKTCTNIYFLKDIMLGKKEESSPKLVPNHFYSMLFTRMSRSQQSPDHRPHS